MARKRRLGCFDLEPARRHCLHSSALGYLAEYFWRNLLNTSLFPGLILVFFSFFATLLPLIGTAQAVKEPSASAVDAKQIEGRWVRPDGGYILQLQDVKEDGSLTATYFNPKPINVSQANVLCKEGTITLFVELRDVNYPGSTYTLDFDSAADRLKGTYFQAVMKQTFEVEFVRIK